MTKFEYQLTEKIEQLKFIQKTKKEAYINSYVNTLGLTKEEVEMGFRLKRESNHLNDQIQELQQALKAYLDFQFRLKHLVTTATYPKLFTYLEEVEDILNGQIDDEYTNLSPTSAQIKNEVEEPTNDHVEFQIESNSINDLWDDGDMDPAGGYGPNSHI